MYQSTKVIDGFSTVFRQHAAESHCSNLHGYSLKFKVVFEAEKLDKNNWVVDFGFLKNSRFKFDGHQIGEWFKYMFDHTMIISNNDPHKKIIQELHNLDVADIRFLDRVGCEAFAELVYNVLSMMIDLEYPEGVRVKSVECIENEKNSAIFVK